MTAAETQGARIVSTNGRTLPLRRAWLSTHCAGGIARVSLEQEFVNPYNEPLAVTYLLPLPADGAVSGFSFRIGETRIVGEIDKKANARERYERALVEGKSAALLEQERSSVFTQKIGNIPPQSTIVAEIQIDQPLRWLDEGAWEWRFPTVVGPRYNDAHVTDAAKLATEYSQEPIQTSMGLTLDIEDRLVGPLASPSHKIAFLSGPHTRVGIAEEDDARLNRDVVMRWPVAAAQPGSTLVVARPEASKKSSAHSYGLLTLVPPTSVEKSAKIARDLMLLIDTSGSMGGQPLTQAVHVCSTLVESLDESDQLSMIEFSNEPRHWKKDAVHASQANKREAISWLQSLRASGSTEMERATLEALRPLRAESQRQVILITDGYIGGETRIVAALCKSLPKGSRLHTVGVGSSVNRSLTQAAARAGRGIEGIIGIKESAQNVAKQLLLRTAAPIAVDVEVTGSALLEANKHLPDLYAGSPALLSLRLKPEGGSLQVRARTATGLWEQQLTVEALSVGTGNPALATRFAREAVEDLETALASGESQPHVDQSIENLGLQYQISTRLTSWIAVSEKATVDPNAPSREEVMPQEVPQGVSAEGVGLRSLSSPLYAMPSATFVGGVAEEKAEYFANPPMVSAMPSAAPIPFGARKSLSFDAYIPDPEELARNRPSSESKGIWQRVKEFFGGASESKVANVAPVVVAESIAVPETPKRTLYGQIKLQDAQSLTIEFAVISDAISWSPAEEGTLRWGTDTLQVTVVKEKSTHNGSYALGIKIRVTVSIPEGKSGKPSQLQVLSGGVLLCIELS